MLEMAIRATSSQIRLTIAAADKLVHAHANNLPAAVSRLGHCKDSYRDALDNLQNAMDAIPDRDFGTINSMLRAAVTDFSDCDDAFVGMAQYSNYDGHLTKMVINCVAIASLVPYYFSLYSVHLGSSFTRFGFCQREGFFFFFF